MKKLLLIIGLYIILSNLSISAQSIDAYYPRGIQMSGDGSRFAIVGRQVELGGTIIFPVDIYDAATYELRISYPINGIPSSFGLSQDGTKLGYVLAMSEFGFVDLETETFLYHEVGPTPVDYVDFSWSPIDDNVHAYGYGPILYVGDLTGQKGGYYGTNSNVVGVGWTITGNAISSEYSRGTDETNLSLWDISTNSQTPVNQLSGYGGGNDVTLSLATGRIAVQGRNTVSIFDSNLNWIKDIPAPVAYSFAWSPDGSELAITTGETLDIWDIETGTISYSYNTNTQYVIWLPNGDLIHDGDNPGFYQNGSFVAEFSVQSNITSLSLLDSSYLPITGHDPLLEGANIDLGTLSALPLIFRANPNPATVGSVKFNLNGVEQIDDTVPYEFTNWTPSIGAYTLSATPYSGAGGSGTAGSPLTIYINLR